MSSPALRYFGGKWRLAPWIISHFPPHRCYVEPFGGGASVLLRKEPAKVEVYNDVADAVVNFFRVLRDRGPELIKYLELTPFALEEYHFCRMQKGDDVERARRFFVRSWGGHHGTNGSGRNRGWRRTPDRNVAKQMATAVENIHVTCQRLVNVAIDSIDWRDVLVKYARPDTLFYVDPPYVRSTRASKAPSDGYGEHDMTAEEHAELLANLAASEAMIVLSGYGHALYEEHLKGWKRVQKKAKCRDGSAPEVLWISPFSCRTKG